MSLHTSYHADSDADDEYERSVITSPHLHIDSESSPTDSDIHSAEHTPTKFGHPLDGPRSPRTLITEWGVDECKEFLTSLGLLQYHGTFRENAIVGEALIALKHDELKEMGINSVGHRLTILKSVYEIKVKQLVPLDADHYIPLSADQSMNETATQQDLACLIKSIQVRDEKLMLVETELRRITDDYRRLREEILPVIKFAKDRSHPLPPPSSGGQPSDNWTDSTATLTSNPQPVVNEISSSSKLVRAFSKRIHTSGQTPKTNSPTHIPPMVHEGRSHHDTLNPSSHLSSMNGGSQLSPGIPSPTSPHHHHHAHPQTLNPRSYTQPTSSANRNTAYDYAEQTPTMHSRGDRLTPSQLPSSRAETPSTASRLDPRLDRSDSRAGGGSGGGGGSENPNSVEIFKSFRVSWEDPCYKVLPAALKKYNINSDWKNYALYIVYGDQERCLELQEKPLLLFKQLEKEGRKPMFMLRKIHMDNPAGTPGPSASAPNSAGFDGGRQGQINLPGGVL
ncbi:Ras-association [Penicillium sp. IBT 31633x]|nr:Ras-association [Penicillium sp. IBT 31633x]